MQPMTTVFQQSRRLVVLCALGLAFFLSALGIEAALVVDLRFADGTTTKDYSTWNPATDRIQVWAKVIGTNTVNNEGIRMVTGCALYHRGTGEVLSWRSGFGLQMSCRAPLLPWVCHNQKLVHLRWDIALF